MNKYMNKYMNFEKTNANITSLRAHSYTKINTCRISHFFRFMKIKTHNFYQ